MEAFKQELKAYRNLPAINENSFQEVVDTYYIPYAIKIFSKIENYVSSYVGIRSTDFLIAYDEEKYFLFISNPAIKISIVRSSPFTINHLLDNWFGLFTLTDECMNICLSKYKHPAYGFTNFILERGSPKGYPYLFENILTFVKSRYYYKYYDVFRIILKMIFLDEEIKNQTLLNFLSLKGYGDLFYRLLYNRVNNYTRKTLYHEDMYFSEITLDMNYVNIIYALILYKKEPLKIYLDSKVYKLGFSYTIGAMDEECNTYITYGKHPNEPYVFYDITSVIKYNVTYV